MNHQPFFLFVKRKVNKTAQFELSLNCHFEHCGKKYLSQYLEIVQITISGQMGQGRLKMGLKIKEIQIKIL